LRQFSIYVDKSFTQQLVFINCYLIEEIEMDFFSTHSSLLFILFIKRHGKVKKISNESNNFISCLFSRRSFLFCSFIFVFFFCMRHVNYLNIKLCDSTRMIIWRYEWCENNFSLIFIRFLHFFSFLFCDRVGNLE
jgi:hypothetical protein